jgi:beta-glucuronidase
LRIKLPSALHPVARQQAYIAGQHVWNLCDFTTAQAVHRLGGINYKGVFTRDRRPMPAAHKLHDLWSTPT